MNRKFRSFACRHVVVIVISLITPAGITTAALPSADANPFERASFGSDWGILSSDIFFGGAEALFGLSPASRRVLLSATSDSKTSSSTRYDGYVGTLRDVFDVGLFGNISGFVGASSPKTFNPQVVDSAAADLFWNTDGVAATWTSANWGPSAAGPFTTAWVAGNDAFFTATSQVTYVTGTSIADVTVDPGITVTVGQAGTMAPGTHVYDIGAGSTLTWTNQTISAASNSDFTKDGAGTWNIGTGGNNAWSGSFTLNSGTIVASGVRAFGGGAMNINGGTIQSSNGNTYTVTSLVIGGNFTFTGTGNDVWAAPAALGSSTRTITNSTTGTAARTFSGQISGTGGLLFNGTGGSGGIVLSGANDYSGGTTLSSGLLKLTGSGTLGSTTGALTVNGGTLDLGGTNQTVGVFSGTGGAVNTTGTSTFTVGNGGGSGSYAGTITNAGGGVINLTKAGAGTLTLTNLNSYSGTTTINDGILELKNTSSVALSGTSGVRVNHGGTLLFSANNQLNQAVAPPITLGTVGGSGTAPKIDAGGTSQGGPNAAGTAGLGALTLNSSATIDLTNTSVLHFANSTASTWNSAATLSILNWSGTPTTGGGPEQLLFGTGGLVPGVDASQLSQMQFIDPVGFAAGTYSAIYAASNFNEIVPGVPIPEPSTWIGGALALAVIGFTQRRRLRGLVARGA